MHYCYQCTCDYGYVGPACDACPNLNGLGPCDADDPDSNGQCIWNSETSSPQCTCSEGYIGNNCQQCPEYNVTTNGDIIVCNGYGTCDVDTDFITPICICDRTHTGSKCQKECNNINSLRSHSIQKHSISSEEIYINYVLKHREENKNKYKNIPNDKKSDFFKYLSKNNIYFPIPKKKKIIHGVFSNLKSI